MDAETPKAVELSLPHAFLLLATNDKDGKPDVPVYALRATLAGAILAELDLLGAISLDGRHVRATGTAPPADLQRELDAIRGKSRPHTPKRWVSMLEGRAEVQRAYEGMAALGIVEHVGERRLGLFRTTRYPEKNHDPEAALLRKIEAALSRPLPEPSEPAEPVAAASESAEPVAATPEAEPAAPPEPGKPDAAPSESAEPVADTPEAEPAAPPEPEDAGSAAPATAKTAATGPDDRTVALIALLQAAGLLGKLFPAADHSRVEQLTTGQWPAQAVQDELRMVRMAEAEDATL